MRNSPFRRRRVVLALLVGASLVLLTASFGSSGGGPLQPVRGAAMFVLGPLDDLANTVFKPVRDLFGWFGSTLDAKDEAKRLKLERDELRKQIVDGRGALAENAQLRRLLGLEQRLGLKDYAPVGATVVGRSPGIWFSTAQIDRGSSDGVLVNQPVIDGDGVVGAVSSVTSGTAVVTLLTDRTSGISAKIVGTDEPGSVVAADGDPGTLAMRLLAPGANVRVGDAVVTAGQRTGPLATMFPPGLPIGTVTKVDPGTLRSDGTVEVRPQADLNRLENVVVLTRTGARR